VPVEDSLLAGGASADDLEYTDLPDPEASTGRRSATPGAGEPAAQTAPDQPFAEVDPLDLQTLPPLGADESEAAEDAATAAEMEAMEPPLDDDQDYSLEFQDEFSRQSTGQSGPRQAPSDLADTVRPGSTRPSDSTPSAPTAGGAEGPVLDESVLRAYDDVVEFVQPGTSRRPRPDTEAETPAAIKSSSPKPERLATLFAAIRDAADRGDYLAAVQAAETLLLEDPQLESFDAREKEVLMRVFEAHLGRMDQVPLVSVPMQEISAANLDHRTGFLLSRIDGMLTYEDILDVAGMPRFEAYRILSNLLRRGFIEVR
jgi:hypothetical protein